MSMIVTATVAMDATTTTIIIMTTITTTPTQLLVHVPLSKFFVLGKVLVLTTTRGGR